MAQMTFADCAAALRADGAFYTDPVICAVADGFYNGSEGKDVSEHDWPGVAVGGRFFKNEAVRIGYRRGLKQGQRRREQRAKRGW